MDTSAKANFRALGRRFGGRTPACRRGDRRGGRGNALARTCGRGTATVTVGEGGPPAGAGGGRPHRDATDRLGGRAEAGETVALDLDHHPELRRAGLAREAIRQVQEARTAAGFDVSDRIEAGWTALDLEVAEALREHADFVAREVLASAFAEGSRARRTAGTPGFRCRAEPCDYGVAPRPLSRSE